MKKKLLAAVQAALAIVGCSLAIRRGSARTLDSNMAFTYRMGAGFPGDVNRTHPVSIEPFLTGSTTPPTQYGQALVPDTANNGLRGMTAGDTAVTVPYGMLVRPYPTQQQSGGMSSAFGAATPPTTGVQDAMRSGYMMVQLNDITASANVKKGDPVFVWCAATAGAHIQGGYEVVASGGNTAALDPNRVTFNGPGDVNGVLEISVTP